MGLYPSEKKVLAEVKKKIHPSSTRQNLCIALIAITIVIPALDIRRAPDSRIFDFISGLPIGILLIVACLGGSIALAFWYPDPGYRLIGIIPGVLSGLGVFGALFLYTSFRKSVFLGELLIPICLGFAPGFLIYNHIVKRRALNGQRTGCG